MSRSTLALMALVALAASGCTSASTARTHDPLDPPALAAITQADLRRDLFTLASPAMRGREAGTLDELRASAWIAEQARAAGFEPAGDDGTYFQFWPIRRTRLASASRLSLGGATLDIPTDAVVVTPVDAQLDLPLVFVGEGKETDLANVDVRGKAVGAVVSLPAGLPPVGRELSARRYTMLAIRQRIAFLTQRGAAAIVLVSDSLADEQFANVGTGWARGSYAIDDPAALRQAPATPRVPAIWVRRSQLERACGGARLVASLTTESFVVPSVNVVARVRGSDASLRDEYVLFSGHQDGLGVRYAWAGDSIWKGADDNATTSVALLAIGRALVRHPARRSALLVWHGSEEIGLLGSRWHATHPVVPKSSIVAVLNGDMIGRNHPDTAALLGSQPPNRNSTALVGLALAANTRTGRFVIDSSWDRPSHPESFFTRSDHFPYVREGIPVVYFSTLLHADYHTPRDEAARVDIAKLQRMAQWMYATGWAAANGARVGLDAK